ncbi:MAG: MFS transporter [Promethearchaeota archaeon]
MTEKKNNLIKTAAIYSFGQIGDITAYQTFTFLIFTFYYAVVGINVILISIGFIIWSVWNAFNDPLLGALSDRTHTRFGRRIPYIMAGFLPLAIIMFLLFTPPKTLGNPLKMSNFVYFLLIIILFELFYTMYSLNLTSLFPEVFITSEERTKANNVRQVFTIIGLIIAFILPSFFISDYSDPASLPEFQIFGIACMIIVIVCGIIFLKFGPKERKEFQADHENAPGFVDNIKYCVKSKSFLWYSVSEICNWFVYGMLPTIVPLYAKFVLGVQDSFLISLLLGLAFISAVIFMTVLWKPLVQKIGNRKTWMISMTSWIATLTPLMFINNFIGGVITFFLIGIGLSGSLYIIDLVVSDIIDEDEVVTGMRREAGYYGVNALFLRFTTILIFLAISTVFTNTGWAVFEPEIVTPEIIFGLRTLIFIFPAIALAIAIFAIYNYPLDGERLRQVKEKLESLHAEKKSKI